MSQLYAGALKKGNSLLQVQDSSPVGLVQLIELVSVSQSYPLGFKRSIKVDFQNVVTGSEK